MRRTHTALLCIALFVAACKKEKQNHTNIVPSNEDSAKIPIGDKYRLVQLKIFRSSNNSESEYNFKYNGDGYLFYWQLDMYSKTDTSKAI